MQPTLLRSTSFFTPGTLVTALVGVVISTIIYRVFFHPLRKIPGPFAAKVTELWRTRRYFAGNWHEDILELHRKYGPVVRVAPNEVSFVDKDALVAVYGHGKGTKKTHWYDTWQMRGSGTSFFNATDPKHHSFLRKRVSTAYSMTAVLAVEPQIQEVADALWRRFHAFSRDPDPAKRVVDMERWANFYAFDAVGRIAIGAPFGFIDHGADFNGVIRAIHTTFFWAANTGYLPGQSRVLSEPLVQRAFKVVGVDGAGGAFANMAAFMVKQFQIRKERGPPPEGVKGDMLDHFIAMREPDGAPATVPSVRVEIGNIIGAGADTTSIGLRSVLGQLLLHPDAFARVRREVDAAYAEHGFGDAGEEGKQGGITFAVAEKLPFLSACVREAIRLHPSILWQLPREVPERGLSVRGYYIPPSATVSMSPVAQNRCREVFGADADEWRPERWIVGEGESEERVREMNKYDVTFGYGSRTCVGKNLALVQLHKLIAQFVHQFDAELVNKERPWVTKSQWFSYQAEMFIRLKERAG